LVIQVHKHDRAWYDKILFQKATNKEEVCAAATMEKSDVESKQKIKVNRRGGKIIVNIE
jgi:hypothetical protein